jgi:hypothetical protein
VNVEQALACAQVYEAKAKTRRQKSSLPVFRAGRQVSFWLLTPVSLFTMSLILQRCVVEIG